MSFTKFVAVPDPNDLAKTSCFLVDEQIPSSTPVNCNVTNTPSPTPSSVSPKPGDSTPTPKPEPAGPTPATSPSPSGQIPATPTTPAAGLTPPPATSTGSPNNSANGLQAGPVAGVAIGCLIVGAAIGALVCFFLFRRRRQQQVPAAYVQHHPTYNGTSTAQEKIPIATTTAVSSSIDNYLPQPVEDDAITKEISRIRDNIKNHARTYYHFELVQGADVLESQLMHIATATGTNVSALVAFLLNPSTRSEAIRLIVAWVLLSKCENRSQPSLLPGEIGALTAIVPGSDGRNPAQSALFSKWKVITGSLLQQHYGKQPSHPPQTSAEAIAELNAILAPFTLSSVNGNDSQRQQNLEMILSRAAKLAFLLFSQPGSFRFDFGRDQRGGLVVFPSLVQVIGDQAELLNPPRLVWEKEIVTE